MSKKAEFFTSHGSQCEGQLFLPEASKPPVVILAQGYGALWNFGTGNFIEAALQAGFAVFAFNYRGFGQSEGEPRQLIDPAMQLDDWRAAIAHVKGLDCIDVQRIAIWGSSFAGGHVISIAAESVDDSCIKAALAQVPHCDSRSAFKNVGFKKAMQGLRHGLQDSFAAMLGKQHSVAIVGDPGDKNAVMDHPGWKRGYLDMAESAEHWENAIPARSLLKAGSYNPIDHADKIHCPCLVIYGSNDQGVPVSDVENTIAKIHDCTSWCFEGDHFDLYDGKTFNKEVVERQIAFLQEYLQ